MIKNCQKCGHQNPAAAGDAVEACPACGAIYSRVEAAIKEGRFKPFVHAQPEVVMNKPPNEMKVARRSDRRGQPFIETLREGSLYPNFRAIVGIFAMLGYVFAAIMAAGVFLAGSAVALKVGGVIFAAFVVVVSKVLKEASLMLADLSDAAVVIAENSQTSSS